MEMHINWLAVAVAAITPMIVGFVWYHPKVLGGVWMKANGFTEESLKGKNMGLIFGAAFGLSILLALFLNVNVTGFGQEDLRYHTFQHGVAHACMLTVLVVLPLYGTTALFERRSWSWLLVNVGYWFVTLVIALGVLSAWRA
jgi:hypothetical protein